MIIEDVVKEHIENNATYTGTLYADSAEGAIGQYYVMFKTADPEDERVLCDTPGTEGQALIRFVAVMGQTTAADGSMVRAYAQILKDFVQNIRGTIGTTTQYIIWNNSTSGVTLIGDGRNELGTWEAVFDALLWWSVK